MNIEQKVESPLLDHVEHQISDDVIQKLHKSTKYSPNDFKKLYKDLKFDTKKFGLNKEDFEESFSKTFALSKEKDSKLLERLFQLFDTDHNNLIDFDELCTGLSLITAETMETRLSFIFQVFDLNGDGLISREEFVHIVNSLWENPVCRQLFDFAIDERKMVGVDVFVDGFFRVADKNKDGFISLEEFLEVGKMYSHEYTDHKLKTIEHQTGGHVDAFKKLVDGKIMKAVNKREYKFYMDVETSYGFLKPFVPMYYGSQDYAERKWVIMEDLTHGLGKPCVMDVKMGVTSAGEDATIEKKHRMLKKDSSSTTVALGFRITGMKVFRVNMNDHVQFSKTWGRKVTPETMGKALREFFHNGVSLREDVLKRFQLKVKEFYNFFENQSHLRFYSSSLLFLYDGVTDRLEIRLKMIDFAHVHPIKEKGRDEGYIFGLKNLLHYLQLVQSSE